MQGKAILILTIITLFFILPTINADETNSTSTVTPTSTPTETPTPTSTPTSTPNRQYYDVGVQVINNGEIMKNVKVVVDDDVSTTSTTGTADFKCEAGLHWLQIIYNNVIYHNSSLVITQPEIFKIDLTQQFSQPTPNSTGNLANSEEDSTPAVAIMIIALTGVCMVIILIKRRNQ